MSVSTSALAALKASLKRRQEVPSSVTDADLDAFGLAPQQPPLAQISRRQDDSPLVLMAKMKSQSSRDERVANCGNCTQWRTCTTLHRAGRVSPNLRACSEHQFATEQ